MWVVYKLIWKDRPEFYVGCTKNLEQRLRHHRSARNNTGQGLRAIAETNVLYGKPDFVVLEEVPEGADHLDYESYWIVKLDATDYSKGGLNRDAGRFHNSHAAALGKELVINPKVLGTVELPAPAEREKTPETFVATVAALARRRELAMQLIRLGLEQGSAGKDGVFVVGNDEQ